MLNSKQNLKSHQKSTLQQQKLSSMQQKQSVGKIGEGSIIGASTSVTTKGKPNYTTDPKNVDIKSSQKQQQIKSTINKKFSPNVENSYLKVKGSNFQHGLNVLKNNNKQCIQQSTLQQQKLSSIQQKYSVGKSGGEEGGLRSILDASKPAAIKMPQNYTTDTKNAEIKSSQQQTKSTVSKKSTPNVKNSSLKAEAPKQQPFGLTARLAKQQSSPLTACVAKQQQPSPLTARLAKEPKPSPLSARVAKQKQPSPRTAQPSSSQPHNNRLINRPKLSNTLGAQNKSKISVKSDSNPTQQPIQCNHQSSNEYSFNILQHSQMEPIDVLIHYCRSKNYPLPTFTVLKGISSHNTLICFININGTTFSSGPIEYENEILAKEASAEKALAYIKILEFTKPSQALRPFVLDTSSPVITFDTILSKISTYANKQQYKEEKPKCIVPQTPSITAPLTKQQPSRLTARLARQQQSPRPVRLAKQQQTSPLNAGVAKQQQTSPLNARIAKQQQTSPFNAGVSNKQQPSTSQPHNNYGINQPNLSNKRVIQKRSKICVKSASNSTQQPIQRNHQSSTEPEMSIHSFNIFQHPQMEAIDVLIHYCRSKNYPLPTFTVLKGNCSSGSLICFININGTTFSTCPKEYEDEIVAKNACAKKTLAYIKILEFTKPSQASRSFVLDNSSAVITFDTILSKITKTTQKMSKAITTQIPSITAHLTEQQPSLSQQHNNLSLNQLKSFNTGSIENKLKFYVQPDQRASRNAPKMFNINPHPEMDPIDVLIHYCRLKNYPLPTLTVLKKKSLRRDTFICCINVNGAVFSTYPQEYESEFLAKEACAERVLKYIKMQENNKSLPASSLFALEIASPNNALKTTLSKFLMFANNFENFMALSRNETTKTNHGKYSLCIVHPLLKFGVVYLMQIIIFALLFSSMILKYI